MLYCTNHYIEPGTLILGGAKRISLVIEAFDEWRHHGRHFGGGIHSFVFRPSGRTFTPCVPDS